MPDEPKIRYVTPIYETVLAADLEADPDVVLGSELRAQEAAARSLAQGMRDALEAKERELFGLPPMLPRRTVP